MKEAQGDHDEPVLVKVCSSAEEGLVLGALLESEGIPYELLEDPASLGNPITGDFGVPREGKNLIVPRRYALRAKEVLEARENPEDLT